MTTGNRYDRLTCLGSEREQPQLEVNRWTELKSTVSACVGLVRIALSRDSKQREAAPQAMTLEEAIERIEKLNETENTYREKYETRPATLEEAIAYIIGADHLVEIDLDDPKC